ncbi:hypothetical protein LMB76_07645 [Limosilactobacillus reuteri]|uniref:Uncharacterized protein n=1 Tax=Limosilactobacillus reuteri TaxID=1598 RepID=A0AAW4X7E2_LIMRT|nr:hypothetical protein [Limosilactobacillus reuteri]MCC4478088.1 hypothetical protein [Limosilactobacillus reuteri]MCC4480405.1 hypothetical protein [Limosilactobacillus reuteri]MCC4489323.1 hypothetical protein [Limosilactobacillus reuteri]MCC4493215.1 hypothetical protein [Limosilactobacillus reuteri]MCC4495811.1 hypothetical protein [Limosilactobacillus reuteri]
MATFDQLVRQINDNLDKQRDRGTAFEKMVVAYLKNEPLNREPPNYNPQSSFRVYKSK